MAHKEDEMSIDDELAAAFLEQDDTVLPDSEQTGNETTSDEESNPDNPTPETSAQEDWGEAEDLPGQLAVDVYETRDRLVVKARTAGIKREDLDVSISENILTISGILNSGEESEATKWHFQECYWGEFSRTIALPVQVKEEGVEAVLKDGVLTISFVKEKTEEPKRIQIN